MCFFVEVLNVLWCSLRFLSGLVCLVLGVLRAVFEAPSAQKFLV